jgi:DNA-binding NarL/FixJ family response regulator
VRTALPVPQRSRRLGDPSLTVFNFISVLNYRLTIDFISHLIQKVYIGAADEYTLFGKSVQMPLSPRELAIIRHLIRGSTNRQIARDLGISEAVVRVSLTGLYRKLGVENRLQVRAWAREHGFDNC